MAFPALYCISMVVGTRRPHAVIQWVRIAVGLWEKIAHPKGRQFVRARTSHSDARWKGGQCCLSLRVMLQHREREASTQD